MGANVNNIAISTLVETKNNSECLNGYLDKFIIPLVLILPKMSAYVKTFKERNNILISFRRDDENLLEKYKTIWTNIEGFN